MKPTLFIWEMITEYFVAYFQILQGSSFEDVRGGKKNPDISAIEQQNWQKAAKDFQSK